MWNSTSANVRPRPIPDEYGFMLLSSSHFSSLISRRRRRRQDAVNVSLIRDEHQQSIPPSDCEGDFSPSRQAPTRIPQPYTFCLGLRPYAPHGSRPSSSEHHDFPSASLCIPSPSSDRRRVRNQPRETPPSTFFSRDFAIMALRKPSLQTRAMFTAHLLTHSTQDHNRSLPSAALQSSATRRRGAPCSTAVILTDSSRTAQAQLGCPVFYCDLDSRK
jgi:hypothetical protein